MGSIPASSVGRILNHYLGGCALVKSSPIPPKKYQCSLPGTGWQAAYLEQGQGIPILMLHGFLGTSDNWLAVMEALAGNYRCIGLDLLGFGASSHPMVEYDIALEVEFVRRFIHTMDLSPVYLMGHSFGGWVAAAFALAYGSDVTGLFLAAAAGIRDDSFCGRYDHLRPLLWSTPVIDWGLTLARPIARWCNQQVTFDQLVWFRKELMTQPAARSFLFNRLRPEDAIDTVERHLHQLTVPTLVVTGDQDETIPLWHSQTYADRIPQSELVMLSNAGHALPQTQPLELATLMERLIHQVEPNPFR